MKPGFWKSETLSSICPFSRLAAIALLNFADDKGYFVCNHLVIRGELFPFEEDSTNVRRAIEDLSRIGFIVVGKAGNGKTYGHIVNFTDHQRVDRPQASEIAGLDVLWSDSTNVRRKIVEPSTTEAEADTEKEGKRRTERRAAFAPPTIEQVREHAQKIGVTDPDKFHSYHASRGWVVGKAPMKSWQHAMQTWLGNQATFSRQAGFAPAQPPRPAVAFDPARRTPMFETRPAT